MLVGTVTKAQVTSGSSESVRSAGWAADTTELITSWFWRPGIRGQGVCSLSSCEAVVFDWQEGALWFFLPSIMTLAMPLPYL